MTKNMSLCARGLTCALENLLNNLKDLGVIIWGMTVSIKGQYQHCTHNVWIFNLYIHECGAD